jgi:hypothetical protein
VKNCLAIIADDTNWDTARNNIFSSDNNVYLTVELLGAIRNKDVTEILVSKTNVIPQSGTSLLRRFRDQFYYTALIRIGDSKSIELLLEKWCHEPNNIRGISLYLEILLVKDSLLPLLDDFIKQPQISSDDFKKQNILDLRTRIVSIPQNYVINSTDERTTKRKRNKTREPLQYSEQLSYSYLPSDILPPLSDFVLNHPLYKARQAEIKTNLEILQKSKKITDLDAELLNAIFKLEEVRAVEAVEFFVPKLLLKLDSSIKSQKQTIDTKYVSIKDYPVAVALAEIGIPSIWGLLDEIAKSEDGTEYREIAYQTMTAILPAVAIPGFVNESLKKHTGEIAQLRLYKMYPLMGLPIEGTPLIPQLREWQSTDKLFKTNAKFISLENGDVTLERANGQCTTIEYSVLRKEDQDYVKEQLNPETKTPKNETTKD